MLTTVSQMFLLLFSIFINKAITFLQWDSRLSPAQTWLVLACIWLFTNALYTQHSTLFFVQTSSFHANKQEFEAQCFVRASHETLLRSRRFSIHFGRGGNETESVRTLELRTQFSICHRVHHSTLLLWALIHFNEILFIG